MEFVLIDKGLMELVRIQDFFSSQKALYRNIESEGVIMRIGDGIVKACGLRSVTAGEMVMMGPKSVKGMALNLEHDGVGRVVRLVGRDQSRRYSSTGGGSSLAEELAAAKVK